MRDTSLDITRDLPPYFEKESKRHRASALNIVQLAHYLEPCGLELMQAAISLAHSYFEYADACQNIKEDFIRFSSYLDDTITQSDPFKGNKNMEERFICWIRSQNTLGKAMQKYKIQFDMLS